MRVPAWRWAVPAATPGLVQALPVATSDGRHGVSWADVTTEDVAS